MLKRVAWTAWLMVVGVLATGMTPAAPRGASKLSLGGKTVTVDYGQPHLAGRDMLAQATIGEEWRLGANAPTTLKSEVDLDFGGRTVPKGEYVLRARRDGAEAWTLLVRQDDKVVAEVPLTSTTAKASVETLSIALQEAKGGGELVVAWGTHVLSATFNAK